MAANLTSMSERHGEARYDEDATAAAAPPSLPSYDPDAVSETQDRPLSAPSSSTASVGREVASDDERARALKRIEQRRAFQVHLTVYLLVMTFLTVIWAVTGGLQSEVFFWPIWPMLGWGLGVALHGFSLRWDAEPTEDQIRAETERQRRKRLG